MLKRKVQLAEVQALPGSSLDASPGSSLPSARLGSNGCQFTTLLGCPPVPSRRTHCRAAFSSISALLLPHPYPVLCMSAAGFPMQLLGWVANL